MSKQHRNNRRNTQGDMALIRKAMDQPPQQPPRKIAPGLLAATPKARRGKGKR